MVSIGQGESVLQWDYGSYTTPNSSKLKKRRHASQNKQHTQTASSVVWHPNRVICSIQWSACVNRKCAHAVWRKCVCKQTGDPRRADTIPLQPTPDSRLSKCVLPTTNCVLLSLLFHWIDHLWLGNWVSLRISCLHHIHFAVSSISQRIRSRDLLFVQNISVLNTQSVPFLLFAPSTWSVIWPRPPTISETSKLKLVPSGSFWFPQYLLISCDATRNNFPFSKLRHSPVRMFVMNVMNEVCPLKHWFRNQYCPSCLSFMLIQIWFCFIVLVLCQAMACSLVDVLLQRYANTQFDNCPFEVFVLGGLSPKKSGLCVICLICIQPLAPC